AAGEPLSAGEATADAGETTVERVAGDLTIGAGNDPSAGDDHGAGTKAVGPEGELIAGARAFHDLLAARVRDRLAYPAVARRRGEEGSVLIDLSVKADGSLESVRISSGSGSAVLDRAALDLVRSLFPFDPPPGGDYTIPLRIQYLLR
ncbi:MAG TPA: energy transducer TonB, partial [Treponemataceae bacterium]|nr:energy transducer TonB [Treponemataceae bacterium]